jgi:mono/diheme cytochrome c family protein
MDGRTAMTAALLLGTITISLAACEADSRGAKVFRQNQCIQCHTIKGKGGAVGPNLTTIGSRRSREWIVQQIKNPSSHNPDTAMPSFSGKLPEQDINDLADYLSGLK